MGANSAAFRATSCYLLPLTQLLPADSAVLLSNCLFDICSGSASHKKLGSAGANWASNAFQLPLFAFQGADSSVTGFRSCQVHCNLIPSVATYLRCPTKYQVLQHISDAGVRPSEKSQNVELPCGPKVAIYSISLCRS